MGMANMKSAEYRRSIFCSTQSCVEVSITTTKSGRQQPILVRDSKNPDGPRLESDAAEWAAFVKGVKSGEFDV